jgi:hypothetical protein
MDFADLYAFALKSLREDAIVRAEVAIGTAVLIALWTAHRKQKRLRAAIRIEVMKTSEEHRRNYTPKTLRDLETLIAADPSYQVTIFTARGHVVIGNLTDDIAYMHPRTAARIILFEDRVRLIDDAIGFMRSETFRTLPLQKKLAIVAIRFEYQDELQGCAMQLISEL